MTGFTKGPWDNDKTIKVRGLNFLSHCHYETSEGRCNASLISAAPELYEALEGILTLVTPEFEESPMVAFAYAALEKARGSQP